MTGGDNAWVGGDVREGPPRPPPEHGLLIYLFLSRLCAIQACAQEDLQQALRDSIPSGSETDGTDIDTDGLGVLGVGGRRGFVGYGTGLSGGSGGVGGSDGGVGGDGVGGGGGVGGVGVGGGIHSRDGQGL